MPTKKAKPDTLEANLDWLLASYNKAHKDKLIVRGNDDSVATIKGFVSTGSDLLDCLMSYLNVDYSVAGRGFALGRWYEIFGPPSSSKSTCTHHAAAEFQKLGGLVVHLDPEKATDDNRAMRIGFDASKCLRIGTEYMEQGIDKLQELFEIMDKRPSMMKAPTLIVVDSVAVIPTKKEYDEEMDPEEPKAGKKKKGGGGMMEKPRILRNMVRKFCTKMPKYNASLIAINQTMVNFTPWGARGTTTPGGDGPRFQYSVRLRFKEKDRYHEYNDEKMPAGKFVRISTDKTKLFRPEGEALIACHYLGGYDNATTNVHFLLGADIIKAKKIKEGRGTEVRYFVLDYGIRRGITYQQLIERAKGDKDFRDWLKVQVFANSRHLYLDTKGDDE